MASADDCLSQPSTAYLEHAPPASLTAVAACLWEQRTAVARVQRVVPDGCLDLIWLADQGLVIAGADTGPRTVELTASTSVSAIRLRAAAAGAVLGLAACELRDQQVPAALIWGDRARRLEEALERADHAGRLALLAAAVMQRRATPDPVVVAAARLLSAPGAHVAAVSVTLGISERQLRRRTLASVGYGPKLLARVARLRRLVARREDSLALRAVYAGYASQSHMNDEVRRLTGLTPVRFLEDAQLTAA